MTPTNKHSNFTLAHISVLVGFFVLIQLAQLWLLLFKMVGTGQLALRTLIAIAYLASFAVLIWALVKLVNRERSTPVWHPIGGRDVTLAVVGFMVFYVIEFVLGQLNVSLFGQGETANNQTINTLLGSDQWVFFLLVFSAVFLSPVVEELLFRGYLFNAFFDQDQLWVPVILSGVVFSLAHASTNPISFLIYAILGAILMWLYRQTDNLATSISLHFLNNAIAMASMVITLGH